MRTPGGLGERGETDACWTDAGSATKAIKDPRERTEGKISRGGKERS